MITTTVVGNLTADPEKRVTQGGLTATSFSVAINERKFDRDKNDWVEGEPQFLRCTAWRELGDHVAESLEKGQRVILSGKIAMREWDDKDGKTHGSLEMQVDEVGPSLRFHTAKVTRAEGGKPTATRAAAAPADDEPW